MFKIFTCKTDVLKQKDEAQSCNFLRHFSKPNVCNFKGDNTMLTSFQNVDVWDMKATMLFTVSY